MNIIELTVMIAISLLLLWSIRIEFMARTYQVGQDFEIVYLNGLSFNWLSGFLGIFFLSIIMQNNPTKSFNIYLFIGILSCIYFVVNILFQKLIICDRLAYNDNEIMFLGRNKDSIKLEQLTIIEQNSLTDKITITGSYGYLGPMMKFYIKDEELQLFLKHIKDKIGFQNIKISNALINKAIRK